MIGEADKNDVCLRQIDELLLKSIDDENYEKFGYLYYQQKFLKKVKNIAKQSTLAEIYICDAMISAVDVRCGNCDCVNINEH